MSEYDAAMVTWERYGAGTHLKDFLFHHHGISVEALHEELEFLQACRAAHIRWGFKGEADEFTPHELALFFTLSEDGFLLYGSKEWNSSAEYTTVPWHLVKPRLGPPFVY